MDNAEVLMGISLKEMHTGPTGSWNDAQPSGNWKSKPEHTTSDPLGRLQ